MFRRYAGFTLSEVLITLGIIGVVAAMTIPTLMNKTNNAEMVVGLKKAYSTLSQATLMATNEQGEYSEWTVGDGNDSNINLLFSYFKPYLNISKDCGNTQDGCWTITKTLGGGNPYWAHSYGEGNNIHIFRLSDGTNVSMDVFGSDANTYFGVPGINLVVFFVDVNGDKIPNTFGKDVFAFVLTPSGLFPAGKENNSANCVTTAGAWAGIDCAMKVLNEGKISY